MSGGVGGGAGGAVLPLGGFGKNPGVLGDGQTSTVPLLPARFMTTGFTASSVRKVVPCNADTALATAGMPAASVSSLRLCQ
jgi:hypothetical protein